MNIAATATQGATQADAQRFWMFAERINGEESDMSDRTKKLRDELKERIKDAVDKSSNIASAVNVGSEGNHTSVSSRQRVVHKDGLTTTVTERREVRSADGHRVDPEPDN